jgi:succinate dehydrogenase / fumarate reductase cytochrome b subunit
MPIPSLLKKYLMALTGFIMVGFLFIHMLGNLQMFQGPAAMNGYAHFLKSLPVAVLWGFRLVLLLAVGVHVWMAILLTRENQAARPGAYAKKACRQATLSSRTMGISGSFILFFLVFHILHFTTRVIFPEYQDLSLYTDPVSGFFDVYEMVVNSFSKPWVLGLYAVGMFFVCLHLSHAVWSMFQTLGWANARVRGSLKFFAKLYAIVLFVGFMSTPIAVAMGWLPSSREDGYLFIVEEMVETPFL